MANENVVSADLNGGWSCVTTPLWQWDYGQVLEITGIDDLPSSFVAHCANRWEGSSQTVLGSNGRISIPNDLLTSGEPVYVWIVLTADGTDGETKYKITIPVNRRAAPTDYPTTAQQSAITQAINALNTAAANAAAEVAAELVDPTLSVSGKAADAAKTGEELSNLKSEINTTNDVVDFEDAVLNSLTWSNAIPNQNNGIPAYSATRLCTQKIKIPAYAKELIMTVQSDYKCAWYAYGADGTTFLNKQYWLTATTSRITIQPSWAYLIVGLSTSSNTDISLSEASNITVSFSTSLQDLKSDLERNIVEINDRDGFINQFGGNWSVASSSGLVGVIKKGNEFEFYGTASGSNRSTLLSGDARKSASSVSNLDDADFNIQLKPNTRYKIVLSLMSGDAMVSAASNAALHFTTKNELAHLEFPLSAFEATPEIELRFSTDDVNTNFALILREVSSTTYSGTYRIYIKELPDVSELDEKYNELKNALFSKALDFGYTAIAGGINTETGKNENATKRARDTGNYFEVKYPVLIKKQYSDYAYMIMQYSIDGTYLGNSGWIYETETTLFPGSVEPYKIRFQFTTKTSATITETELSSINDMLTFYSPSTSDIDELEGETNVYAAMRGYTSGGNSTTDLPVFVHITDVHGDATRLNRALKFAKRIGANGVFGTGDFVDYLTSASVFSFIVNAVEESGVPFYPCNGNHEQISNTQAEQYSIIFQPLQEQAGYTLASVTNPTYWHKDLDDLKIRLISVNQFEDSSSQWIYDISQDQVNWLCDTISETPEGYGIIVLEHAAETQIISTTETAKFCQSNQTPYLIGTIVSDIVDAYISGTAINKTYQPQSAAATSGSVTANYNFANKNEGTEFIAFVSGHYHKDYVHYESGRNNTMLNLNACCTAQNKAGGLDLARVDGTPTQDAFNVYVFDRERKVVKIVRVGSHLTYNFETDRNYLELPYLSQGNI